MQKKKCSLESEEGFTFTIKEVIEKKLNKAWLIRREAQRVVSWNEGTMEAICSCNSLVYRGMPCIHIALVALLKKYQIPLKCFNERYCYLNQQRLEPSQPAQCEESPPPPAGSSPPSSQQHLHPACDKTEFVPGHELHITEAFLNAKFGDDESVRIRGEMRSVEIMILQQMKPLTDLQQVLDTIQTIRGELQAKIDQLSKGREGPRVVVAHASQPNRRNSYKTVPMKVARATGEAVKRPSPSTPTQEAKKRETQHEGTAENETRV